MMTCQEFAVDIADTLAGSATPAARARAEAHFGECSSCRANAALWQALGDLPADAPSPALQVKFGRHLSGTPSAPR